MKYKKNLVQSIILVMSFLFILIGPILGQARVSQMSDEEFSILLGEKTLELGIQQPVNFPFPIDYPVAIDWRNKDGKCYVTRSKDQGTCSSCVAFAAVSALESLVLIENNRPNTDIDLSEMSVYYCSGHICGSGWDNNSAVEYLKSTGAPNETCWPYTPSTQDCSNSCPNWQERAIKIINGGRIEGIEQCKTMVAKGPIMASMAVYKGFKDYSGGIIEYDPEWEITGHHAVCIVGYGLDPIVGDYWIVKNSLGEDWGENGFFRIKMGTLEIDTTANYWIADAVLPLIPDPSITISSPNGGEALAQGFPYTISWTSDNVTNVKIELQKGTAVIAISASVAASDGSYSWTVPINQALGSDYKIRITDISSNVTDYSDANFSIVAPPSVTVEVPNGGEIWVRGTVNAIGYGMFPDSNVKIELLKGGALDHIIINTTPGEFGFYDWTIPSTQAPGSDYKIRITNYYDNKTDSSDTAFSITSGLPTFVISATAGAGGTISPSGSVIVSQGASQTFTIAANLGYAVQGVTVDGVSQGAITSYTFPNVQAGHAIAATFAALATYTITATAGAGGTISPSGSVQVTQGANQTFMIAASSGYGVYSVNVDGVVKGAITSYTFPNIQANHTISATFGIAPTLPTYTAAMLWLGAFGLESGWNVDEHPRLTADVNGDGKADIVGFAVEGVWVSLATGTGFTPAQRWVVGFGGEAGWYSVWHIRTMADVNGDGKADVVGFGSAGVQVSLSTGTGFAAPQNWSSSFGLWAQSGGWEINQHPRYMADVNGDGKMDVVGFYNDGVYVALSTGSAFAGSQKWLNGFGVNDGWNVYDHPRALADVNGDGKADLVGFGNAGAIVALSTGSGFTAPALWVGHFGFNQAWYSNHPRLLADVNGDGKKDVVGFYYDGVYVSLSTGTGFTPIQKWVNGYGSSDGWNWNKPRFLADANGDGRADVIGFGTDGVRVSLSTGTAFMSSVLVVNNFGTDAGGWGETWYPRTVADINGDGKADVVGFGYYGVSVSLSTSSAPLPIYTITAAAGANGTISPSGSVVVTQGGNQTFTITANAGYKIANVTVDGINQSAAAGQLTFNYPFTNVMVNHEITAQFDINQAMTYTVTVTAGVNGSVTPGTSTYNAGTNATFLIQPSTGYKISQILLDGSAVSIANNSGQSVPISNIQANHTLSAIFAIRTFTISIAIDGYWNGGTTNPAPGLYTVNYGSNFTITATPNPYNEGKDMTVDGVFQNFLPVVSFTNITANHTYYVRFRGL
jgi:hypothetical protein